MARAFVSAALGVLLLCSGCAPRDESASELAAQLHDPLGPWVAAYRQADSTFTLEGLQWRASDTLSIACTTPPPSMASGEQRRQLFWIYSPDSAYAVDVDVYQDVETDAGEIGYDADASTILVERASERWMTLSFCGTGCRNDDAVWLSPRRVVLAGWSTNSAGDSAYPVLALYDIARQRTRGAFGGLIPIDRLSGHADAWERTMYARIARKRRPT